MGDEKEPVRNQRNNTGQIVSFKYQLTCTILWRKTNSRATLAFFFVMETTEYNGQGFYCTYNSVTGRN